MTYNKLVSLGGAVAITAAGLFVMAPPASAKPPIVVVGSDDDVVTRHISYADLNMASASGEQTLHLRVGSAVRSLCRDAVGGDGYDLIVKGANRRCQKLANLQAGPQIDQVVQRAREIAFTGTSNLAAVAITIALPE